MKQSEPAITGAQQCFKSDKKALKAQKKASGS
jgi:hypothetical protein